MEEEPLRVQAEMLPGRLRISIMDFCCPEDVPRIKPRNLKAVRPGGLGTHFVDEIMDSVAYEPDPKNPDRMVLVLEKSLTVPPSNLDPPDQPNANDDQQT